MLLSFSTPQIDHLKNIMISLKEHMNGLRHIYHNIHFIYLC